MDGTEKPLHWRKWKLTEETLYKPDRAMPYWLQFAPPDFIRAIADDMEREVQGVNNLVEFMLGDSDAAALTLDDLSRKMTVQEICELILRRTQKAQAILNIACAYANVSQSR
jgi:hypothetical protein